VLTTGALLLLALGLGAFDEQTESEHEETDPAEDDAPATE
jgi:hypothetical protein